jgi:putative addiction module antidote
MRKLKVTTVGGSTGVVLPKDLLDEMNVKKGDVLTISKQPDGSYKLSPYDEEFERKMAAFRRVMAEDKDILRELAK